MLEMNNEELTFKPNLSKTKHRLAGSRGSTSTQPNAAGLQKYLERVQKANKLKEEKKQIEDKVFGTGKNWTPQITQPSAPKLTVKKNNYLTKSSEAPEETATVGNSTRIGSARPQ
mmetsp:Transcript_29531/g.44941  ORF Transcript_29531/g.44941 Transcript_29531/m.44941 type:complete len:115 (-) Transcript_29531:301-645(-)